MKDSVLSSWKRLPHPLRWITVAIVGFTLVATGIVFMVLPGPGIPILILGLAILATEFAWARTLLHRVRHHSSKAASAVSKRLRKGESNST